MVTLIQRVNWAQVRIKGTVYAEIGAGLLAFIGIEKLDTQANADGLLQKILSYRVFSDSDNKMNLSIRDVKGSLLLVSQFTLAASTEKGLR
ncbi:MAG TPA: D-tyrosyl-tRNA(Tyr) deacylase, partial [Gammaproteobacteria bacterium]|nr:D-tyrosyl-tRNA(Tyr) deacylase [Gammaproteobacteria bacterium]